MTKGAKRMQGKADCAELPGRLLEGSKTSKNRAFGPARPKLPFASKGGGRIVSASRSPPGLDPKRVHFWSSFSPGSEKGPLLELIFALGELFGVIFGSFFDPWEHFGSAGSPLFDHKTVWATKGAPRSICTKIQSFFWIHLGVIFCVLF